MVSSEIRDPSSTIQRPLGTHNQYNIILNNRYILRYLGNNSLSWHVLIDGQMFPGRRNLRAWILYTSLPGSGWVQIAPDSAGLFTNDAHKACGQNMETWKHEALQNTTALPDRKKHLILATVIG